MSLEEIQNNPGKFGAPTFEEFKRNRSKYLGKKDDTFGIIDHGSRNLRRAVNKHIYEIEGYQCKTLEEVERVAKEQLGLDINDLDYRPDIIPQGGGRCDIKVKFISKAERARRAEWR